MESISDKSTYEWGRQIVYQPPVIGHYTRPRPAAVKKNRAYWNFWRERRRLKRFEKLPLWKKEIQLKKTRYALADQINQLY